MPSLKRKKLIPLPLPPLLSTLSPLYNPPPHPRRSTTVPNPNVGGDTDEELLSLAGGVFPGSSGIGVGKKKGRKGGGGGGGGGGVEEGVGIRGGGGLKVEAVEQGREPTEEELIDFYQRVGGIGYRFQFNGNTNEQQQTNERLNGNAIAGPSSPPPPPPSSSPQQQHSIQRTPSKAHLSFLLDEDHPNTTTTTTTTATTTTNNTNANATTSEWTSVVPGTSPHKPGVHHIPTGVIGAGYVGSGAGGAGGAGKMKDIKEPEVWFIKKTGEVFTSYDAYIQRVMFYQAPVFTCEVSGKTDLTYFQALTSETEDTTQVHRSFPEPLKGPILRAVQFQMDGRLDDMVDKIADRLKDRFFVNEKLYVDIKGEKLLCCINTVLHPSLTTPNGKSPSPSTDDDTFQSDPRFHEIGLDVHLTSEEANQLDDPSAYTYRIELITIDDLQSNPRVTKHRFSGPMLNVQPSQLIREKNQFHKVMLRKYLRECLTRDQAIGSPWHVKAELAERYNVKNEMSEEIQQRNAAIRLEMINKRKKPKHEEEDEDEIDLAPANKKQKMSDDDTKVKGKGKGQKRKIEDDPAAREREAAEKAEEEKRKKRKPTKFPAEDILIEMTDRDREIGMVAQRPIPSRHLPFAADFDQFLATWTFMNTMSGTLALQPFTIDEFEHALYHSDVQTPCILLNEIHSTLLNLLIREQKAGHPEAFPLKAFGPLGRESSADTSEEEADKEASESAEDVNELEDTNVVDEEDEKLLYDAANDLAMRWTEKEISARDSRKGWESVLIGCLWSRANLKTLPNLLNFVKGILWEGESAAVPTNRPTWKAVATRPKISKRSDMRYLALHSKFKLEILVFLVELVGQSVEVRNSIDVATAALSKCRNDQNEAKRELKRITEDLDALEPKADPSPVNGDETAPTSDAALNGLDVPRPSVEPSINDTGTDRDELDESRLSPSSDDDVEMSDITSDIASGSRVNGKSAKISGAAARQKALAEKKRVEDAQTAARQHHIAQQREDEKAKKAVGKSQLVEKRRLADERETTRLRLEELDREFRSQISTLRTVPIGMDRFGNKYWWMDGTGSAPLVDKEGGVIYGTGRIYLQGGSPEDLERRVKDYEFTEEEIRQKRLDAEGEDGILEEGEWAMIDSPEDLIQLYNWLQPRGILESRLLKLMRIWRYAIEGGFQKRVALLTPTDPNTESDLPNRRARVGRTAALSHRGKDSYLSYRNKLA